MGEYNEVDIEKLVKKVQQHEDTITQLIEIIAATNCQLFELMNKQKRRQHILPHS